MLTDYCQTRQGVIASLIPTFLVIILAVLLGIVAYNGFAAIVNQAVSNLSK